MAPDPDLSREALARHADFLRALARGLLRDEHLAEDATQDALLATLRRPPPPHVRPVAWLATLTKRAALTLRRGTERRARREALAARADSQPAAGDALERSEILLRVAEAVVLLPEPYRATILARYYEDLAPRRIAARDRVPLATVKSRLTRAHALLRERLEREHGRDGASWRTDLAALCGWPAGSVAGPTWLLKSSTQLALAAALLVAGSTALWRVRATGPSMPARELPDPLTGPDAGRTAVLPDAPSIAGDRTAAGAPNPASAAPLLLSGSIRGPKEEQLAEAVLEFQDDRGKLRKASLGPGTHYSVFGLVAGPTSVRLTCRGFVPLEEELVVPADVETWKRDFDLRPSLLLPVRFVDATSGALLRSRSSDPAVEALGVGVLRDPAAAIHGMWQARIGRSDGALFHHPRGALGKPWIPEDASGVLEVFDPLPANVSLLLRDTVLETRALHGGERELVFRLDAEQLASRLGSLSLACVEARTGLAVEGAWVEAELPNSFAEGTASTDAAGRARIGRLAPGLRRVEIRRRGMASVEHWVRVDPGRDTDLGTLVLAPLAVVRGRIVAPDAGDGARSDAIVRALVPARIRDPREVHCAPAVRTELDGGFELDDAEAAPLRLVVEHDVYALAWLDFDATGGSVEDVEVRLERGREVSLRTRTPVAPGMQLCTLATEDGTPLLLIDPGQPSGRTVRLAPGRYRASTFVAERVTASSAFEVVPGAGSQSIELP